MKKVVGIPLSYLFYYIGDIACRIRTLWGARLYQNSMHISGVIQDWCGADKPWKNV